MKKRKLKPSTIRTMAFHRGLTIHKAKRGGWFITLRYNDVLYCSHLWSKIETFVKKYPILIKRHEHAAKRGKQYSVGPVIADDRTG